MSKETGPAPAEAEGVNVPKQERVMPSIAELNAANKAEAAAAERRDKGETPSGALERLANEADARAQEKLLAQNTGLLNRITNIAKRGWEVVKGIGRVFGFVNKDIVLPVKDAFVDIATGRKEDGEAVGVIVEKIAGLQQAIRSTTGEARKALEAKLAEAEDDLEMLRDPHNAARALAEREKAQAKADQVAGKAFLKSEEEQMKAEKLAADVAAAKEKHAAKLEREALDREARLNLGRGVANLLAKVGGEDTSNMSLSEGQLLALGTVINGAKRGVAGALNLPSRIQTGLKEYKDEELAKAKAAYEMTADALDAVTLGEDRRELWAFTKDAVSFTGAVLMNKDVQQEVLDVLGQEQEFATDDEGNVTEVTKNRGTANALANAIKDGAVSNVKLMGGAIADAAREIRDSEAVASAKRGVVNTAKVTAAGAGGFAAGTAMVAATPFALAAAPYMMGAALTGAAAFGTYRGAKAGYEAASTAVNAKLTEMAPAIADKVAPIIESTAQFIDNAMNARKDGAKEFAKLGEDMNAVLLSTAEDINANTRKAAAAYNTLATRMRALKAGAIALYNKLEAEAITEAAKAKNPEVAANVSSAINLNAEVDAATSNIDAPEPRNVKPVIRQVRGSSSAA